MSRTGMALAAIYFTLTCICLAFAFSATDAKSQFVLLQAPIALQLGALDAIGLHDLLPRLSWTLAYLVLALPGLIGLYCVGWVLELPFRRARAST